MEGSWSTSDPQLSTFQPSTGGAECWEVYRVTWQAQEPP
jgi:hypothetical protein